jgi:hypothetical protein
MNNQTDETAVQGIFWEQVMSIARDTIVLIESDTDDAYRFSRSNARWRAFAIDNNMFSQL